MMTAEVSGGAYGSSFTTSPIQPIACLMPRNRLHHLALHHGIELFEAEFSNQTFARHAHEGFAIGAIAEGAGGYVCRGESMVLPAGSLSLMNPEEVHTGHAAAGRVRYNMLYASEVTVRKVLGLSRLKGFAQIAPQDQGYALTRALARLADCLNRPGLDRMACEEAVDAGEDLSLSDLATGVRLNPSYLIRATARATGLTPHRHVLRVRIDHPATLFWRGCPRPRPPSPPVSAIRRI